MNEHINMDPLTNHMGHVDDPEKEAVVDTQASSESPISRKMSKRKISFLQIINKIRDSIPQRSSNDDNAASSSVFYVGNEDEEDLDDDDHTNSAPLAASTSPTSPDPFRLKPNYENIPSSGSECNGTLICDNQGVASGKNKFGFSSVGNLGESCGLLEDKKDDENRHAFQPTTTSNIRAVRRRCTVSEQNLNDAIIHGENNESENESEFGPQSLFIMEHGGVATNSEKMEPTRRRAPPDRRIIAQAGATSSSSSGVKGIISGQQEEMNGWQVDGTGPPDGVSSSDKHRQSGGSSTSRASTTSSESLSEMFARNFKRTFRGNKMKQVNTKQSSQLTAFFVQALLLCVSIKR